MVSIFEQFSIGTGRFIPTATAVIALVGVLLAVWSWFGNGRAKATAAIVLGFIGATVGALHATNAAGGVGTGNGLAGAIVAIALGFVAMALGAARFRSRNK